MQRRRIDDSAGGQVDLEEGGTCANWSGDGCGVDCLSKRQAKRASEKVIIGEGPKIESRH